MAAVIVYFSTYHNTQAAAEYLAAQTQAALVRLQGAGGVNPLKSLLQGTATPQGDAWTEIAAHERIILMSPIYAFNDIPEICGFLKRADLRGKRVLLLTSGLAPAGKFSPKVSRQYTALIERAGGQVDLILHHPGGEYQKFSGATYLQQQVEPLLPQITAWLRG